MNDIMKNEISEYKLKCNRDMIKRHLSKFVNNTLCM